MTRRRIYLSAPGLLCCAGKNGDEFFRAALEGDRSGIVPQALSGGRSFFVGRIKDEALPPENPGADPRLLRIAGAALEQIRPEVARVTALYGPERIAVCVGSCDNGSELSLRAHGEYFSKGVFPKGYELRAQGAAYPAEFISRKFGLSGPSLAVSTACASSAGAVVRGAELIRAGICDAVIAGGVDVVSETVLLGFDALETISETPCNPFSKNRDGITLGEGAAFFVMSPEPAGSGIELMGMGESADAYHITLPRPDGTGAARAMKAALSGAGIGPGDVGYVNLHGTGTPANDLMEARAIAAVFPDHPRRPLVSSTKPVTGHTLGASGALELALCWMSLRSPETPFPGGSESGSPPDPGGRGVPIHCWDGRYDEALPVLRFALPGDRGADPRVCMSNSFAFGGCNVSLILGREVRNV